MSERIVMFIYRCNSCEKTATYYDEGDAPSVCPICKQGKLNFSHEEILPADEDEKNG